MQREVRAWAQVNVQHALPWRVAVKRSHFNTGQTINMSIMGATSGELLKRLDRGDLQSQDVVTAYLDAIAAQDGQANAFLNVDQGRTLAQARAIDVKRTRAMPVRKRVGVPR